MKHIVYKLFILGVIICLSPLLLVIPLFIVLLSGFPVLFRQKRIGKSGIEFEMYKFRTMVNNADVMKYRYIKLNEAHSPAFKIHNDPRHTKIGRFLSHTGLDELPQLLNVLKGEMALIGPRPLPVDEAAKLKPWMQERHTVKPGIVSPWIFEGYHATPLEDWMRSDIAYARNKAFLTDVLIALKSVFFIMRLIRREVGVWLRYCLQPVSKRENL